MAELLVNSATPGQASPLCSLLEAMPASTPGAVESYAVSAAAPFALRLPEGVASAQFRVVIDDEYLIVTAKADGSSPWLFQRGMENSPPMQHLAGASVYFSLTAGGVLQTVFDEVAQAIGELGGGAQGPPGPPGATGAAGVAGAAGTAGATGPAGAKGDTGPSGATGPQGTQGTPGAQGVAGAAGAAGPIGPQGTSGQSFTWKGAYSSIQTYALDDAVMGSDGSAYISMQGGNVGHDPAVVGNTAWWSQSVIHGAVGPQGPTGATGPAGAPGPAPTVTAQPVTTAGALPVGQHTPVDTTAGALTMTLPTGQAAGRLISVEKYDSSTNVVTVSGSIRGSAGTIGLVLQHETVLLESDGSGSWWPFAGHKTLASLDTRYTLPGTGGPGQLPSSVVTGSQVAAGNLGASYALNLASGKAVQVTGTLTANCVINVTGLAAGVSAVLLLSQDATGGRTLSVNDGSGAQLVAIPTAAGSLCEVLLSSPNGTDLYVTPLSVPGPPGLPGAAGAAGATGATGATGANGSGNTVVGSATLPVSPVDGQVFSLLVDDTAGIEWQMRWDAAKSLWRCIGGNPLTVYVAVINGGSSFAMPTAWSTYGGAPSVTLPSVGTSFDVVTEIGGQSYCNVANTQVILGYSIAGATPATADPVVTEYAGGTVVNGTRTSMTRGPIENVASGAVIVQRLKSNLASAVVLSQVFVSVRCVQIHP